MTMLRVLVTGRVHVVEISLMAIVSTYTPLDCREESMAVCVWMNQSERHFMGRKPSGKPRRNIWTDPSPYGTYTGEHGNPDQWREFFRFAFASKEDAQEYLRQEPDSPLSILGLALGATLNEIKSAFRKLSLLHHPDKGGNVQLFKKILAAYTVLTS